MMAPVDGSGSWPAWMQTVEKRAFAGSFTRTPIGQGLGISRTRGGSEPRREVERLGLYDSLLSFGFQLAWPTGDSRTRPHRPAPAGAAGLPMPPDDSGRTARDLLLNSWPGRLFIIAAALKILVALVRLVGDVPSFLRVLSSVATVGLAVSVLFFLTRLVVLVQAPPALARTPEADPLLHLHRRRPVAADPRILPARHRVRGR